MRSRDLGAPGSALSAAIVLQKANADGTDLAFVANRGNQPAEFRQTYTSPTAVRRQTTLMTVNFHAGENGTGDLVATASATVAIAADGSLTRADGSPLGALQFNSAVQSVVVTPPTDLLVGSTVELPITVFSATGVLAVSPGSIHLRATSGLDVLGLRGGASVKALRVGVMTVVATVDGKESAPTQIAVTVTGLPARTKNLVTSKLVFDPTRNRIWAALPPAGDGGNAIVAIDPATGDLGTPIPVGSNPTTLAISDDGSTMYVGLKGSNSIRRVDLAAGAAVSEFPIFAPPPFNDPGYPLDMELVPGTTSSVAVTVQDSTSNGTFGPFVYDDGVRRPNTPGVYDGTRMVFTSPTRLVAVNYGFSPTSIYDYAIGPQGATVQRSVWNAVKYFSYDLQADGDRIYSADGTVLDATSLAKLGDFLPGVVQAADGYWYGPAIDRARNRAYFVGVANNAVALHVYRLDTLAEIHSEPITGIDPSLVDYAWTSSDLMRWGTRGLAFRLVDRVVFLDDIPDL